MKPGRLPEHRVLTYLLPGNRNYRCHAIEVRGVRIHSQIGPYGAGEVEARVRAHVAPAEQPGLAKVAYVGHTPGTFRHRVYRDNPQGDDA